MSICTLLNARATNVKTLSNTCTQAIVHARNYGYTGKRKENLEHENLNKTYYSNQYVKQIDINVCRSEHPRAISRNDITITTRSTAASAPPWLRRDNQQHLSIQICTRNNCLHSHSRASKIVTPLHLVTREDRVALFFFLYIYIFLALSLSLSSPFSLFPAVSRCTWHTLRSLYATHTARAPCNTRLTHARRVRGVRAKRGGMRCGFYFLSPSGPLSLPRPTEPRVRDKEEVDDEGREWEGGGGGGDEEGSSPQPTDPRHPRSTSRLSLRPLPGILLSRDRPPPPSSTSSPTPLSGSDSRTHLPPVPTLGALGAGRDVTPHPAALRHLRRRHRRRRLLARAHRDERERERGTCMYAQRHAQRTPYAGVRRTSEEQPARSATMTMMLFRVPTFDPDSPARFQNNARCFRQFSRNCDGLFFIGFFLPCFFFPFANV